MIDYILIFGFLGYLAIFSFKSYKEVHSINAFSMGIRSISTYALGATITATWVSGSGFFIDLTEFYSRGLIHFIESLGMCFALAITGMVIAPKMKRFLGKISVASIMGEEYGQTVRLITAFSGCFAVSGGIYIQFKLMGKVLFYLLPFLNEPICIFISSLIVIGYSFSGGINNVVTTDKVQAFCFMTSLLIGITIIKINSLHTPQNADLATLGKHFYLNHISTFDNETLINSILLFLYFFLPGMSPHVVQRISMGINIKQVKYAYLWSAFWLGVVLAFSCYFSYLVFQTDPYLERDKILPAVLDIFSVDGTKAILVIGIISMCMSTADSNLNIGAILVANDTWKCNTLDPFEKLTFARYSTIVIGLLALLFCFKEGSFLQIFLFAQTFYMPIVTVPLLAVIFGFKTTERICLFSMFCVFIYIMIYKFILNPDFNIIPYGMALNAVVLISSHYIVEKWQLLKFFGITSQLKGKK